MRVRLHDVAHSGCARRKGYYRFSEHIEVPAFDGEHCVFCGQTFGTFVPQPEAKMGMYIYETPSTAATGVTRRHLVEYQHPARDSVPYEGTLDDFIQETEAAGHEAMVIVGDRIYLTQKYLREKYNFPPGGADRQALIAAASGRPAPVRVGGFEMVAAPRTAKPPRAPRAPRVIEVRMPAGPSATPQVGKSYRVYDVTQTDQVVTVRQIEPFGALCSDKKWRPLTKEGGCHWEEVS